MKGSFNLSDWALKHQSFVWYLMFVALLMGVFSYMNLGREEDPSFTIKTMVIQTRWPGATQEETLKQVTDRIEKKLEELDSLDYVKSYTRPGESTVYVYLRDTTKGPVILVTKDACMALKAQALGLEVQDYRNDRVETSDEGEYRTIKVTAAAMRDFRELGQVQVKVKEEPPLILNEYVMFTSDSWTEPARHVGGGAFVPLGLYREFMSSDSGSRKGLQMPRGMRVIPKNFEQWIFLDALLNPDIKLVTCFGRAGTGDAGDRHQQGEGVERPGQTDKGQDEQGRQHRPDHRAQPLGRGPLDRRRQGRPRGLHVQIPRPDGPRHRRRPGLPRQVELGNRLCDGALLERGLHEDEGAGLVERNIVRGGFSSPLRNGACPSDFGSRMGLFASTTPPLCRSAQALGSCDRSLG